MTDSTTITVDKRFSSRVMQTERVLEVAEAFGLGLEERDFVIYDHLPIEVHQGDVIYITGQSGSGKSLVLREIAKQLGDAGRKVANIDAIELEDRPLIDQIGKDTNDAVRLLSLAGLNDAYLLVRNPGQLSDGQKYRFRLAKVIESGADVWVADEFCAVLDRATAKVVSFNVQRAARKVGATVVVATTHTDLTADLKPSLVVEKYYKEKVSLERPDE
ncbi:ABC transporter [Halomonas sp. S2151]|uniref:adenylyl-sulfate kinase n=1 Tax=Halomonas sp. S2151 TaxID=579478 RepID=UPI0005FA8AE6|nr:adenylyl-sulfate kinase [Halomonas sp. S2151]KJZ17403.1 ABC transporter [Halomonas sp. S2151]